MALSAHAESAMAIIAMAKNEPPVWSMTARGYYSLASQQKCFLTEGQAFCQGEPKVQP